MISRRLACYIISSQKVEFVEPKSNLIIVKIWQSQRVFSAAQRCSREARFSTWKLKFTALATKDGLACILEHSYIPSTDPEKHLFSEQKQFLFAVFTQTLVDPTAKDILCRHQATTDAQKIYSESVSAATNSACATLAKQEILKFLTSVKLDHSW